MQFKTSYLTLNTQNSTSAADEAGISHQSKFVHLFGQLQISLGQLPNRSVLQPNIVHEFVEVVRHRHLQKKTKSGQVLVEKGHI